MRTFLNAWLRRWADASLRTELHHAQDRLIRAQDVRLLLEAQLRDNSEASQKRLKSLKQKQKRQEKGNERLIQALRARMPEDLFLSVAAHVREMQKREVYNS